MIADSGRSWDIFCKVVDNFGDAGVCWRLARQLANEHGLAVRLWCDQLPVLARLAPDLDPSRPAQRLDGVDVHAWPPTGISVAPADVVIEAFACHLPPDYIAAMATRPRPPVWINLEYLSAESWVGEFHRQPSPHPRLPLVKHFFFPGFTTETGGLLRERGLLQRRQAFLADSAAAWRAIGAPPPVDGELCISLFGYENPALSELIALWEHSATPVRCLVRPGRSLEQVAAIVDRPGLDPGARWQCGNLTVQVLPFCRQEEFDRLLWVCDLNFVRGEDSFVRALWAARPLVWHIYPQDDEVHLRKLEAFRGLYCAEMPLAAAAACRDFWLAWNRGSAAGWEVFRNQLHVFAAHAERWTAELAEQDDLAKNLAEFVESRLKLAV